MSDRDLINNLTNLLVASKQLTAGIVPLSGKQAQSDISEIEFLDRSLSNSIKIFLTILFSTELSNTYMPSEIPKFHEIPSGHTKGVKPLNFIFGLSILYAELENFAKESP